MTRWRVTALALTVLLIGAVVAGQAQTPTKVTVFEAWLIHNESMGVPVAIERGVFKSIAVAVVAGGPGLSAIDRVVAAAAKGGIAFGVDSPYNVLDARERRKLPLVVVAHDFQQSAVRLISWTKLASLRDVKGTIAIWKGYEPQVQAALGRDWAHRATIVDQQGEPATLGAWLRREYQFAHAMTYNELIVLRHTVKAPYYAYDYSDFGIRWPENAVFTTEDTVKHHPGVVQEFVTGRYRGFAHALSHRDEAMMTLIKYNPGLAGAERHEREGMSAIRLSMVTPAARKNGLGTIDPAAWELVARDLTEAGLYTTAPDHAAAYTTKFPSGVRP